MKMIPKIYTELSQVTHSCNNSSWTEFYNIDIASSQKLESLVVNSDHDHKIKIVIDSNEIFNASIDDLIQTDFDDMYKYIDMPYFTFARKSYQYFILQFDFSKFNIWGQTIKIYSQRIDNKNKNLSINTVTLIYQEQII